MVRLRIQRSSAGSLHGKMLLIVTCLTCLGDIKVLPSVEGNGKMTAKDLGVSQELRNSTLNKHSENSEQNTPMALSAFNRISRSLPNFNDNGMDINSTNNKPKDDTFSEYVQKLPYFSKHFSVIPYTKLSFSSYNAKQDPDTLVETDYNYDDYAITQQNKKRHGSMIPMPRFGRSKDTLIPNLRFGRSVGTQNSNLEGDEVIKKSENGIDTSDEEYRSFVERESSDRLDLNKNTHLETSDTREDLDDMTFEENTLLDAERDLRKRQGVGSVIPYPRLGRSGSLIPQIRFGRSMVMIAKGKNIKNAESPNLILPYPRPGRSSSILSSKNKQELSNKEKEYMLLPYPRPGRTEGSAENEKEAFFLYNSGSKREGYMLPLPRMGKNDKHMSIKSNDLNLNGIDIAMLPQDGESLFQKELSKEIRQKYTDTSEKDSHFIIPYPRPGKRLSKVKVPTSYSEIVYPTQDHLKNSKINNQAKQFSDYILPYPRPGKRDYMKSLFHSVANQNKDNGVLSDDKQMAKTNGNERFSKSQYSDIVPYPRPGRSDAKDNGGYIIPYLRPGRSDAGNLLLPFPRPGRSANEAYSNDYALPYPRPGRSENVKLLLPYPRIGRSTEGYNNDYALPYPRPGRSRNTKLLPYPRHGRSNAAFSNDYALPYPRPGRSGNAKLLLPYPRPGRSGSAEDDGYMLPYPRPGRSDSNDDEGYMLPYPRPGRSGSSEFVVPYPRPGRSSSQKDERTIRSVKPGQGQSNPGTYVIPQPRLGRSDNEIKSTEDNIYDNNETAQKYLNNVRRKRSIVPYPRVGRSKTNGRLYILPYPRTGRSNEFSINESELDDFETKPSLRSSQSKTAAIVIIPNTAHKLNKHMATDNSYLLPYPRPGRVVK